MRVGDEVEVFDFHPDSSRDDPMEWVYGQVAEIEEGEVLVRYPSSTALTRVILPSDKIRLVTR